MNSASGRLMGVKIEEADFPKPSTPLDIPDMSFKGPF